MMRKLYCFLFLWMLIFSAACGADSPDATPSPEKTPIIYPTATYRAFLTIAPDNVATSTPTPTIRPLRVQPQGRIAFQSNAAGSLDIYVMNADGSQISRLTNNAGADVFPAWSPDGSRIAFVSDMNGSPDLYVMSADGVKVSQLTNDEYEESFPAWSPDGKTIAYVSNRGGDDKIFIMNEDGSSVQQLTSGFGSDVSPSWSPDGEWIAFASTRDVNSEIYKMDRNGKNLIRLTDDPAVDYTPAWSPDGSRIAFVSRRDGFTNLFLMDPNGENVVQLTKYKSTIEVPSWSPDSKLIAIAADFESTRDIFIISSDGTTMQRLTSLEGEEFYPAWSPSLPYLAAAFAEPTAVPEAACVNAGDPSYGFTIDNPIRIGYDPRDQGSSGSGCMPWLLGPQGQVLDIQLVEEVEKDGLMYCKVSVTYEGQNAGDILYFDTNRYEQPKAPVGFTCGSPVEYLKAITAARY